MSMPQVAQMRELSACRAAFAGELDSTEPADGAGTAAESRFPDGHAA